MEATEPTAVVYRAGLPVPPPRVGRLPVRRGYPVPWFVAWVDEEGTALPRGSGTPDFRVLYPGAVARAHRADLCFICGQLLGVHRTFVIGPMCAVNRVSSEPPSHRGCAEWAVQACPFLTRPHMERRENNLPDVRPAPGIAIARNPGVTLLWDTRSYQASFAGLAQGDVLFRIGTPERVSFFIEGRPATRAEVVTSIESGLPVLRREAKAQGPFAEAELDLAVGLAMGLLPA